MEDIKAAFPSSQLVKIDTWDQGTGNIIQGDDFLNVFGGSRNFGKGVSQFIGEMVNGLKGGKAGWEGSTGRFGTGHGWAKKGFKIFDTLGVDVLTGFVFIVFYCPCVRIFC